MSGFLDEMARSSAARVAAALRVESWDELERRARHTPRPASLKLSPAGFDVIAELKFRSPAAGMLGSNGDDWLSRVSDYARGGAAAVSVLTEPSRFDGALSHLTQAAAALAPFGVPAMRKDFLVDPYQVLEARAAGAGGVLVIVRMLGRAQLTELLEVAAAQGLFALLEAFDEQDLELSAELMGASPGHQVLLGVNCRDLQTLDVVPERFATLAPRLPRDLPTVAESGVASADDARAMRKLGYRLALIGTALMAAPNPRLLLREILGAARNVES